MFKMSINDDIIKINSNYRFPGYVIGKFENPDIEIYVGDFHAPKNHLSIIDLWYYGDDDSKYIYFEDVFFGLKNKVFLHNLEKDITTRIGCNKNVLRLDKLYPPRSRQSFQSLIDSVIKVKLIFNKSSKILLGGQIAGPESVAEMINLIAVAVQQKMTAQELANLQVATHPLITAPPTAYPVIKAAEAVL